MIFLFIVVKMKKRLSAHIIYLEIKLVHGQSDLWRNIFIYNFSEKEEELFESRRLSRTNEDDKRTDLDPEQKKEEMRIDFK